MYFKPAPGRRSSPHAGGMRSSDPQQAGGQHGPDGAPRRRRRLPPGRLPAEPGRRQHPPGIHPDSQDQAFCKPSRAHQAPSQLHTDSAGLVPHMNGEAELTIAGDVTGIQAAHKYADFATSAIGYLLTCPRTGARPGSVGALRRLRTSSFCRSKPLEGNAATPRIQAVHLARGEAHRSVCTRPQQRKPKVTWGSSGGRCWVRTNVG